MPNHQFYQATIACRDPQGFRGDFLYQGNYPDNYTKHSPTFLDLQALHNWCMAQGIAACGAVYISKYPLATVE